MGECHWPEPSSETIDVYGVLNSEIIELSKVDKNTNERR